MRAGACARLLLLLQLPPLVLPPAVLAAPGGWPCSAWARWRAAGEARPLGHRLPSCALQAQQRVCALGSLHHPWSAWSVAQSPHRRSTAWFCGEVGEVHGSLDGCISRRNRRHLAYRVDPFSSAASSSSSRSFSVRFLGLGGGAFLACSDEGCSVLTTPKTILHPTNLLGLARTLLFGRSTQLLREDRVRLARRGQV
jgi:hypothetical protein